MCVSLELRKMGTEKFFLRANDGSVNYEEDACCYQRNPPTSRSDGKASGQDKRSEIKWITRVGIGATHGENFVLFYVARSEGPHRQTEQCDQASGNDGRESWPRQPDVSTRENKSQRHSNTPRYFLPARHWWSPVDAS